ncbi:MAG: hypothetical protein NVSMB32_07220 [Actinomycetota bacterium]
MSDPAGANAGTSILVVEDDANVAEVLSRYLRREGFDVTCLDDGAVALELALASPPDLAVLDIMLPGLSGLEVCRRLRASGDVPIIMLTALGEEADRVVGLELGADDYVTKPFSPREVTARVKAILRRTRGAVRRDRNPPRPWWRAISASICAPARSRCGARPWG